jgi:hypothetical protein
LIRRALLLLYGAKRPEDLTYFQQWRLLFFDAFKTAKPVSRDYRAIIDEEG